MKKTALLLILFTGCFSLVAQVDADRPEAFLFEHKNRLIHVADSVKADTATAIRSSKYARTSERSYKGYFSIYGSAYINSNSITNSFVKSYLYTASFIDADMKQVEVDRLTSSNKIGADIQFGLYGQYKVNNLYVEAGLKYRDFYSSQFSEDAYKLIFYGNSMFAGQEADLGPLTMNNMNYQALYAGVKKKIGRKDRTTIGAHIGFVRGAGMQHVTSKNLSLYTEADGAYLEMDGDVTIAYTEDEHASKGNGLYTDLSFSTQGDKGSFVAEVLDLGFIRWNNASYYEGHGTYRYDGVTVDNILADGSLTINPANLSTFLDAMGLEKQNKQLTYLLPTTLHVSYIRHLTPKLSLAGGVKQQFVSGYIPRVYGKLAYYIKKDLVLVPMLAYGGFGRADMELGLSKTFKDHLIVSANLFWLEYVAWPNQSSGHGMSVAFSYYF